MLAGQSSYEVGTKIKITHVGEEEDQHLIGLTGTLTHPFMAFSANFVGVILDENDVMHYGICNLAQEDEFELINHTPIFPH